MRQDNHDAPDDGVYLPTAGEVSVLGVSPTHFSSRTRRKLGYMSQHFALYPDLSVWENMNFLSASLYGMGLNRGRRLKEPPGFVELYEHRDKLGPLDSGGMQAPAGPRPRRWPTTRQVTSWMNRRRASIRCCGANSGITSKRSKRAGHARDYDAIRGRSGLLRLVAVMTAGLIVVVDTPAAFGGEMVELQTAGPIDHATIADLRALPYIAASNT